MLSNVLELMRAIDLKSFAGGLAVAGSVAKAWSSYRKARQAEAVGSHFTMKDGVSHYGDGARIIRYSAVTLRSWTGVQMHLTEVKLYWPPFTRCLLHFPNHNVDPVALPILRQHDIPRSRLIIQTDKDSSFNCIIELNAWTRFCALWQARARIKVTAETIDAQSRRTSLKLRSRPVDWDRPPQE